MDSTAFSAIYCTRAAAFSKAGRSPVVDAVYLVCYAKVNVRKTNQARGAGDSSRHILYRPLRGLNIISGFDPGAPGFMLSPAPQAWWTQTYAGVRFADLDLEAAIGIEPMNKGFADLCLTTWLRRHMKG